MQTTADTIDHQWIQTHHAGQDCRCATCRNWWGQRSGPHAVCRLDFDSHPFSAQQIYQRLREEGYTGGVTRVREHVAPMRPGRKSVYVEPQFAPDECAQVDWGEHGTIAVGNTRRRLSSVVMVVDYSRLIYVEFTVPQTVEHFLGCHVNTFRAIGGVPRKLMVDNLKSAVLKRPLGEAPVFNPRYLELAKHSGFAIERCTAT